jgi:2-amino-4-hydroxy-6-hydroxymethyldihydropteridine diphosphokinase
MAPPDWTPAYIGVGSNLDEPREQVARGIDALAEIPRTELVARSKLYLTAPMGPQDQPRFVNAVVGVRTQLDATTLLAQLKMLETRLGRAQQPVVRWGPRVIDFDLLVFGTARIENETLRVPHPGIAERAFVLIPLLDIAPDLDVPGVGRVRTLAARVNAETVEAI